MKRILKAHFSNPFSSFRLTKETCAVIYFHPCNFLSSHPVHITGPPVQVPHNEHEHVEQKKFIVFKSTIYLNRAPSTTSTPTGDTAAERSFVYTLVSSACCSGIFQAKQYAFARNVSIRQIATVCNGCFRWIGWMTGHVTACLSSKIEANMLEMTCEKKWV